MRDRIVEGEGLHPTVVAVKHIIALKGRLVHALMPPRAPIEYGGRRSGITTSALSAYRAMNRAVALLNMMVLARLLRTLVLVVIERQSGTH